nr:putative ribonuclease H-like domain-containing protein [Tanacetum cinerariifolium]
DFTQTVVATSSTEAKYVAAASGCAQVLWMQNQLLDYGYNFMHTVIYIDNRRVNIPRSDEDRLKLIELMVFLLQSNVCVEIGINAARLSKLLLSGKFLEHCCGKALRTSPSQAAEGTSILVQQVLDKCSALVLRVEGLESANTAQQLEILKLKARVKKLERLNKVKSSKLRRLKGKEIEL